MVDLDNIVLDHEKTIRLTDGSRHVMMPGQHYRWSTYDGVDLYIKKILKSAENGCTIVYSHDINGVSRNISIVALQSEVYTHAERGIGTLRRIS